MSDRTDEYVTDARKRQHDKAFKLWMREVDIIVQKQSDLSVYDLPDCCFRDWFDDGISASRAAKRALKNAII